MIGSLKVGVAYRLQWDMELQRTVGLHTHTSLSRVGFCQLKSIHTPLTMTPPCYLRANGQVWFYMMAVVNWLPQITGLNGQIYVNAPDFKRSYQKYLDTGVWVGKCVFHFTEKSRLAMQNSLTFWKICLLSCQELDEGKTEKTSNLQFTTRCFYTKGFVQIKQARDLVLISEL